MTFRTCTVEEQRAANIRRRYRRYLARRGLPSDVLVKLDLPKLKEIVRAMTANRKRFQKKS